MESYMEISFSIRLQWKCSKGAVLVTHIRHVSSLPLLVSEMEAGSSVRPGLVPPLAILVNVLV